MHDDRAQKSVITAVVAVAVAIVWGPHTLARACDVRGSAVAAAIAPVPTQAARR